MVVTVTGVNSYTRNRALSDAIAKFVAKEGDMALERLSGDEVTIERISEALTSLPFLSTKKMIVLHQASANKQFIEQAADMLATIPETTEVIVVEPKLDKRSAYYKYLKKSTDFKEYNELDQGGLARWLVQVVKEQQGSISASDAAYLIARVGQSQQLLAHEIDKLILYAPTITKDTIDALTEPTPQSTVFELLEAAFSGNTRRALQLYAEQRALKVEPQQIIAMLSWQLHILALLKTAGERSPETVASEAKVSPYVVKKSLNIARKLTRARLQQLVAELVHIDGRSKRETFDINAALQHFILTLTDTN